MAIIVRRKTDTPLPPVEPIVDEAKPRVLVKQEQRQASIDWWAQHGLPVNAKPVPCNYCGNLYLKPCGADNHALCQNFQLKQKREGNAAPT